MGPSGANREQRAYARQDMRPTNWAGGVGSDRVQVTAERAGKSQMRQLPAHHETTRAPSRSRVGGLATATERCSMPGAGTMGESQGSSRIVQSRIRFPLRRSCCRCPICCLTCLVALGRSRHEDTRDPRQEVPSTCPEAQGIVASGRRLARPAFRHARGRKQGGRGREKKGR